MELKPALQNTEFGFLPIDWKVSPLHDLNPFITSGSRGWAKYYAETGSAFIRITNMDRKNVNLDLSDLKHVQLPANHTEGQRTQLKAGDVLISITADIGISAYVDEKTAGLPAFINQHIALVRFNSQKLDSRFVSYFLASAPAQKRFLSGTDVGAKAGMSLQGVANTLVALPPYEEQKAIADTLVAIDALLAEQDKLLAKKRDIKKGVMQELLTGKRRLKGFENDCKLLRLGDVANFQKGKGLSKAMLARGGASKCIHYGELFTTYGPIIDDVLGRVDIFEGAQLSHPNDVLMPTSDVTPRGLATASCVLEEGTILGGDILIIRSDPEIVFGPFLAYCIRNMKREIMQLVSGSTVYHIYPSGMAQFEFWAPPYAEQVEIVYVLSDMDKEIRSLEAQRDKTAALKQGMMQQLLTGKIRLT